VENGSIYISKVSAILESGCRVSGNVVGFPMNPAESIDIDEETDFELAECVMAGLGMES
jgi:CMP-N-acetylneuraminic acid synthetase